MEEHSAEIYRRLKVGNLESVKRDHFRPEVVPFQRPLTFPQRTYGVVLRKGRILTPQARRFVGLLLQASAIPTEADLIGNGQKNGTKAS
jgi:hypothetical protein